MKHRITWRSPDNITKKIIDVSILESWTGKFLIDVRVYNSCFESDVRLIIINRQGPTKKLASAHINQGKHRGISFKALKMKG